MSEITKFVPTTLIVRRDPNKPIHVSQPSHLDSGSGGVGVGGGGGGNSGGYDFMGKSQMSRERQQQLGSQHQQQAGTKSTDSAYESFMKEIGKLL
jgi:hypothetical protein